MLKGVNFKLTATNGAQPAFNQFNRGLRGVQKTQRAVVSTGRSWNAGLNANRRAVQQFGYQMSDFAIQIGGGQSALLAFTQQGGQMLQFFGPAGAVLAAVVAVFGSLALAFLKSGRAMSDLFPLMGVLQDEFRGIGRAVTGVKEIMFDFANVVVNNLDVILIALALVTGFFVTKWVRGFLIAKIATMDFVVTLRLASITMSMFGLRATAAMIATSLLTTGLKILRTAFLRLGIPALVIAAGYLIERFMAMSEVAGGAGNMFRLLGQVVKQAFDKMIFVSGAWFASSKADNYRLRLSFFEFFEAVWGATIRWSNNTAGAFKGTFDAMVVIWKELPNVLGSFMFAAVNAMLSGIGKLLNKVTDGLNKLIKGINKIPKVNIPELLGIGGLSVTNPYEGAGEAAGAAMRTAFTTALEAGGGFTGGEIAKQLGDAADNAAAQATLFDKVAASLAGSAAAPIAAWEDFKRLWEEAKDAKIDVRTWFKGDGADGGAAGDAKEEADRIKAIFDNMSKSISSSMLSGFKSLLSGAKSFGEAARDILGNILDKVIDLLMTPVFNSIAGSLTGGIQGLLGGIGASFEGGGFTGVGPRAGGLDGKGGTLAMVHPNETVVDHTKGQTSGGVNITMNITTPDADSFRKSRTQIQAELARAVQMGTMNN